MKIRATNIDRASQTLYIDTDSVEIPAGGSIDLTYEQALLLRHRSDWNIDWTAYRCPTFSEGWIGYSSAVNTHTGYGKQGYTIMRNLMKSGFQVAYHSGVRGVPKPKLDQLDPETIAQIQRPDYCVPEWGLLHHVIEPIEHLPNPRRIAWSMWEADRLPDDRASGIFRNWADKINRCAEALIVPAQEQKRIFCDNSGVEIPTYVVHDAIDTSKFSFRRRTGPTDRPFTFAMWAYMNSRKAPWQVVNAFTSAFGPNNPNVRLIMKTVDYQFGGGSMGGIPKIEFTNNVTIINEPWSEDRLLEFVHNEIDCGLFGSYGEGFYDPPLEALSTGLPVIVTDHSGSRDYCDDTYLYPIRLKGMAHAPQGGRPHTCAESAARIVSEAVAQECPGTHWWVPDFDHAINLMREVYGNYDVALRKAEKGSRWVARRWSIEHQRKDLMKVLKEVCGR